MSSRWGRLRSYMSKAYWSTMEKDSYRRSLGPGATDPTLSGNGSTKRRGDSWKATEADSQRKCFGAFLEMFEGFYRFSRFYHGFPFTTKGRLPKSRFFVRLQLDLQRAKPLGYPAFFRFSLSFQVLLRQRSGFWDLEKIWEKSPLEP